MSENQQISEKKIDSVESKSYSASFSGSKLKLKSNLIGYNGKPVVNSMDIEKLHKEFPNLTTEELLEKCPPFSLGEQLASILIQVAGDEETKEATQKLKLFRWASKISHKLETDKGELDLDLNQITELFDYVSKVKKVSIIVQGPILVVFEDMREGLTKNDLR